MLACTHTEGKLTDFATDEFQTEEIRKSISIVFLELLISRQMESERMIFNVARLISSLSRWLTFSARQRSGTGIARVLSCVLKMNWISHRHLSLNISKTELITLLPHHQIAPPESLASTVASCHSSQRPSVLLTLPSLTSHLSRLQNLLGVTSKPLDINVIHISSPPTAMASPLVRSSFFLAWNPISLNQSPCFPSYSSPVFLSYWHKNVLPKLQVRECYFLAWLSPVVSPPSLSMAYKVPSVLALVCLFSLHLSQLFLRHCSRAIVNCSPFPDAPGSCIPQYLCTCYFLCMAWSFPSPPPLVHPTSASLFLYTQLSF